MGLLGAPWLGFGQSTSLSGSQSGAVSVRFQILHKNIVYFGQHSITFNRVAPPVFPVPVSTPTPTPDNSLPSLVPAVEYDQLLFFSATVYDHQFSVIQRFGHNAGLVAVSNVNFEFFDIFGFTAGNTFYDIFMALDHGLSKDADATTAAWLAQARGSLSPISPGYVVVSGTASADDIRALDALHSYFSANSNSLIQAYRQQQAQNAERALQLKLHPPVRPNTVINYWPIKSNVYITGSNQ
jgi:hypothetical protein